MVLVDKISEKQKKVTQTTCFGIGVLCNSSKIELEMTENDINLEEFLKTFYGTSYLPHILT
tara:strand:+ start:341 stop:523 length:183 start_codon:yes stop_codon:yes gene_type:complete